MITDITNQTSETNLLLQRQSLGPSDAVDYCNTIVVCIVQRAKMATTVRRVSSSVNVSTLKDRATRSPERADVIPDTGVRDVIVVSGSVGHRVTGSPGHLGRRPSDYRYRYKAYHLAPAVSAVRSHDLQQQFTALEVSDDWSGLSTPPATTHS